MDFGLSPEQEQLQDTLRRFLAEQCPSERLRAIMESDHGHDPELWRAFANLGVCGLNVPAEHDGSGLELLDVALAAEQLGYAATPLPFLGHAMATVAIVEGGTGADPSAPTAAVAAEWLPRLASGDAIGAVALGEADGEWRPEALRCEARAGKLTGHKPIVPGAQTATCFIVAAAGESGPELWLTTPDAGNVTVEPRRGADPTRRVAAVTFEGTPAVQIGAAQAVQRTIDAGCVLLAADAYGGARRALDMTVAYTLEREQFGQSLAAFQAVKHQLADLLTEIEPSLALWWYAAHAFDQIRNKSERHAAIAKAHLCDVFDQTMRTTTELHGGIGFTWEYDLQIWFRRAIFDRSYLGESRYHRARAADIGWG